MAKLPLQAMGAYAAEQEKKKAAEHDRKHAKGPDLSGEACVDCGEFGPFSDREYHYCKEHLPDEFFAERDEAARFAAENPDEYRRIRQEHARRIERAVRGHS